MMPVALMPVALMPVAALDGRGGESGHSRAMPANGENNSKMTIILGAAVVVVGAVVAFALLQKSPPPPQPVLTLAVPSATPVESMAPMTAAAPPAATPAPVKAASPGDDMPAWESTIDEILRSNASEAQMAQMLINLLPTLPEDGQIEAANHIANLLPDSDYNSVRPLLLNASLPESVLSVFFTDLMNRDDPVKLNAFLDIAQIPNHPFHDEALSDLQIYVGDDYGTDWGKWQTAVSDYLKTSNAQ